MADKRSLQTPVLAEDVYAFVQHFGRRLRTLDAELGLSPARFSVLGALAFHGQMNLGALAEFEGVKPPSMTRLVRDMEEVGLLRRRPDSRDGRAIRIAISRKGRALVKRARQRKIRLVDELLKGSSEQTRAKLRASLDLLQPLE